MESIVIVDWQNNNDQISSSYTLTDEQVKEGLSILNRAKELYDNLGDETPQCIMLFDRNNNMIHKIMTLGGKPETVEVRPKLNLIIKNKKIIMTISGIILVTFLAYYSRNKFFANYTKYSKLSTSPI